MWDSVQTSDDHLGYMEFSTGGYHYNGNMQQYVSRWLCMAPMLSLPVPSRSEFISSNGSKDLLHHLQSRLEYCARSRILPHVRVQNSVYVVGTDLKHWGFHNVSQHRLDLNNRVRLIMGSQMPWTQIQCGFNLPTETESILSQCTFKCILCLSIDWTIGSILSCYFSQRLFELVCLR